MIDLPDYLSKYAKFMRVNWPSWDGKYLCEEELVLDLGQPFTYNTGLPDNALSGEMRMCFQNALFAAREVPDATYCEGIAVGKAEFPVLHAWIGDAEGNCWDPTWEEGHAYYGIAFDLQWATERMIDNGVYGLLGRDPRYNTDFYETGIPAEALLYETTNRTDHRRVQR